MELDELRKVAGHCGNISRNKNAPGVSGDLKNFRIGSAIGNNASRTAEIEGRLVAS